jgi:hypothetical protein
MSAHRTIVPLLAAAVAATFAQPATAQTERFELSGERVAIYNLAGQVTLVSGSGSAVVVEVTRGGGDGGSLRIERGPIEGSQTLRVIYPDDEITYDGLHRGSRTDLRVREDGTFGGGNHRERGQRVRIRGDGGGLEAYADLTIRVPAGRTVAVYQAVGEVSASGVTADLRLDTHSAPVTATDITGDLVVDVGSGRVDVSGVQGSANLDTGSGAVEVTGVQGDFLRVDTGSGSVTASNVSVSSLEIDTGSGEVRVADAAARDVGVDTGSGSVELELTSETQSISIDTGSGGVTVTLPDSYSATVDIETGSGGIDLDFPVQVRRFERDHVYGTIGDGSGSLKIDTGSGSVRIRKAG